MSIAPNQITICITVYSRRQYLKQAISSALAQTVPVRVMVVEDCGPDPTLQDFVKKEFGDRIQYVRNPVRRGLFGNWNACIDSCGTEWLSILHDDDYLAPGFVEAIIELADHIPGQALYFGRTVFEDRQGHSTGEDTMRPGSGEWQRVGLEDVIYLTPFPFPGQLFKVSAARAAGGFRESSFFCGDWEMWARLIAMQGAAQTAKVTACKRGHDSWDKGTNAVVRGGRHMPATFVQQKRVLAMLPPKSRPPFDRVAYHRSSPLPTRFLFHYGASLRPRLLAYHIRLLLLSRPPHWRYALYQQCARVGGAAFVRFSSRLWNLFPRSTQEKT